MPSQRQAIDTAILKSVMGRLAPLSNAQRTDVQVLVNQGIPAADARAIVQGGAVKKDKASDNYRKQQRIQSLRQQIRAIEQSIQKDGPGSSDVHVQTADGDNLLGFRPPNKQTVYKQEPSEQPTTAKKAVNPIFKSHDSFMAALCQKKN